MIETLVAVSGLRKSYRSGAATIRALADISLVVEKGDFLAILGRSGSGKSTLLHILGLLDRPDSGRYMLNGQHVEDLGEETRAAIRNREIGFVFQSPTLLPRATAVDNVALPLAYAAVGRHERGRLAEDALAVVGLAHRASHWPQQLSGGEQQRVAIARAIVTRPALILADEPTGALDSTTSDEILSLFAHLNGDNRTIIVVTHDEDVARRAGRRITLHDGSVIKQDAGRSTRLAEVTPDRRARS
jgi:ABC-type lipoprotein export system ATPase subunit